MASTVGVDQPGHDRGAADPDGSGSAVRRAAGRPAADAAALRRRGARRRGRGARRLGADPAGRAPLDGARTAAQLEVRDGEMLYFTRAARPRRSSSSTTWSTRSPPPPTSGPAGGGRPTPARFAVSLRGGGAASAARWRCSSPARRSCPAAGRCWIAACCCSSAPRSLSRAGGDSAPARCFGLVGAGVRGVGGLLLLAGDRALADLAAPHVLLAATALVVTRSVAAVAVGDGAPLFLATAVVGTAIGLGAAVCLIFGTGPAGGGRGDRGRSPSSWCRRCRCWPTGWPGCPCRPCRPAPRT